ncbi:MAG: 6-bladed beta-propeller [Candidatus Aminicenantes bacterium]|nr:6-bladed beta-propeller [Candidatus Aminicenantes bacterium]
MTKKRGALLSGLILCFCTLVFSIEQKSPEWKGKIKQIDGIKVVENPSIPLNGKLAFNLAEELRIGNDIDANQLLNGVREIKIDNEGNIYILDMRNYRVQVFDKNGHFLLTIGKKGHGPGEFSFPKAFYIDRQSQSIHIADYLSRKIIVFSMKGEYLDRDILMTLNPEKISFGDKGDIWGVFSEHGYETTRFLKHYNGVGKELEIFMEKPYQNSRVMTSKESMGRNQTRVGGFFFHHGFEYDLYFSKISDEGLVFGYSDEYVLHFIDGTGELNQKVTWDAEKEKISRATRDKIKQETRRDMIRQGTVPPDFDIDFPDYAPFFYGLVSDDEGRIYVQRTSKAEAAVNGYVFDVLDREGIFIYTVQMDYYPYLIEEGCLYTVIVDDETGTESVVRFRIKNWDRYNSHHQYP